MVKWLYWELDASVPEFDKPILLTPVGGTIRDAKTLAQVGEDGWVLAQAMPTTGFYWRFIFKRSVG